MASIIGRVQPPSVIVDFVDTVAYTKMDRVRYKRSIYECVKKTVAGENPTTHPDKWFCLYDHKSSHAVLSFASLEEAEACKDEIPDGGIFFIVEPYTPPTSGGTSA